ncbi:putative phiE125 gp8 family phage protein [Sphingomonas jinjuensis]|uniref:Putative phiE125 gp8 family phage protein n=1 Tax=Sphingomonas jinjuensis TaxID=535907 RepID=A0A840FBI8_9SPHN|nr:hypothetical protein [Sphingomonas jinjuensis]MBB4152907.1 putative phiE125 gp8 family phage protein [Sphingomonas jinjuensis]
MLTAATTIVPPAAEPITAERLRNFLRLDTNALDYELELIAAASREDVEATTGLRLITQTVRIQADDFTDLERLDVAPVQSIAALTFRNASGVDQDIASLVELTGAGLSRGIATRSAGWPPSASRIAVNLVVGFGASAADVPANLRHAIFAIARGRFENKPADIEPLVVNYRLVA